MARFLKELVDPMALQIKWKPTSIWYIDVIDRKYFKGNCSKKLIYHEIRDFGQKVCIRCPAILTVKGNSAVLDYTSKKYEMTYTKQEIEIGSTEIVFSDLRRNFVKQINWHQKGKPYKNAAVSNWGVDDEEIRAQEGASGEMYRETKSRSRILKPKLIRKFGCICQACGFSFSSQYGELGVNYIEIHHLILLSSYAKKRETTDKDVKLVCSNCHRMLHKNGKLPMKFESFKRKIRSPFS